MFKMSVFFQLFFVFNCVFGLVDQAPCIDIEIDDQFNVCTNSTLATVPMYALKLANGQIGVREKTFKFKMSDQPYPESSFAYNITICKRGGAFCDECKVNYTSACSSSGCICTAKLIYYHTIGSIGGNFYDFEDLVLIKLDLDSGPYKMYEGNQLPFGLSLYSDANEFTRKRQANSNYFASLQKVNLLTVRSILNSTFDVRISLEGYKETFKCVNFCELLIDNSRLVYTTNLDVSVYEDDYIKLVESFPLSPDRVCPIHLNPFHKSFPITWSCSSDSDRAGYVFMYIGFIALIIVCIYIVYKIYCCCYHSNSMVNINIMDEPRPSMTQNLEEFRDRILNKVNLSHNKHDQIPLDDIEDLGDALPVKQKARSSGARSGKSLFHYSITIMCLFCIIGTSSACSNVFLNPSSVGTCTISNGIKDCKYSLDVEVVFTHFHEEACIYFTDDKNEILFHVGIELIEVPTIISLEKQYITSAFDGMSSSKRNCPGSTNLGWTYESAFCKSFNNITESCNMNWMSREQSYCSPNTWSLSSCTRDPVECLPGEYFCAVGSNKGCGIFDYGDAFLYGKYGLLPKGPIFKVFNMADSYMIPMFNFTVYSNTSGESFSTIIKYVGYNVEAGNFSFSIISSLERNDVYDPNNKIIIGSNQNDESLAYMGPASARNAPIASTIGDIQADFDNEFSARTKELTQFIYERGSVDVLVRDTAMDFRFPQSGITRLLPKYFKFPNIYRGNQWTISNEEIIVLENNPPPIRLRIFNENQFTLSKVVTNVCPVVGDSQNSMIGCSSCYSDFEYNITLKSTCEEGIVSINMDCKGENNQLLTKTIKVTKEFTTSKVYIKSGSEILDCKVYVLDSDIEFNVYAITPENKNIVNNTRKTLINDDLTTYAEGSSFSSILDWFNGPFGTIGYIVKWIIISGCIVLGVVGISIIFYVLYPLIVLR